MMYSSMCSAASTQRLFFFVACSKMAGLAGLPALVIVLSCVSAMLVDSKLSTYTPAQKAGQAAFIKQPPLRLNTHVVLTRLATTPRTACAPVRDRRRIVEVPEKSARNAQYCDEASDKGAELITLTISHLLQCLSMASKSSSSGDEERKPQKAEPPASPPLPALLGLPTVEIEYCTGCRWMLRAAWLAQVCVCASW